MRKQAYPIVEITGGLNVSRDPSFLVDKESPNIRNFRFHKGLLRKDLGKSSFGSNLPLDGTVMYIDTFWKYDGSSYLIVCTTKWIYEYNPASQAFIKRNPSDFDTGAIAVTFSADDSTITRSSGSFLVDGFVEGGTIYTSSVTNPGPFEIVAITGTTITVSDTLVDDADTYTIYNMQELTGTEDNAFDSVTTFTSTGYDIYYLTNGLNYIMSWQGEGIFTFRTDYAKRLATFQSRLILGFTIEGGLNCPTRIKWSVAGDPEDMSGTGSGFVDLVTTVDWISALRPFKDKLFVCKETSIWELVYVGGVVYFLPIIKIDGIGTYAPNSVCSMGEEIIFLAGGNVYTYDGISPKEIGNQLSSMLFDTGERILNASALHRCTAIFVEESNEYWLTIPTEGSRTSLLLKYNFTTAGWSRKDVEYTALGYHIESESITWNDLVGDWDAQDWIWMERKLPAGTPTTLIGDANGYVYEDTRLDYDTSYACFETKDWFFAYAQRWVEFRIIAKGTGAVKVSYSINAGETWSLVRTFTPNNNSFELYTLPLNVTSEQIRCKIETNATDLIIKWIEPWYIARARAVEATRMT